MAASVHTHHDAGLTIIDPGSGLEAVERAARGAAGAQRLMGVANAQGVRLTEQDVQATLALVRSMPATWRASLAVDPEQGRRLEIDWLSGAVCRLGRASAIDTPLHRVAGLLSPHAAGAGRGEQPLL